LSFLFNLHSGGASCLQRERERERLISVGMAWEEEAVEEEDYGEEMSASESEEDVVVGQMPTVMVPKHINKRSLKNKALSVTLDKKALRCGYLLCLLPVVDTVKFLLQNMTIPVIFVANCVNRRTTYLWYCGSRDLTNS
jgi:hypothetical protein